MDMSVPAREAAFAELRRTFRAVAAPRPHTSAPVVSTFLAPLLPEGLPQGGISLVQGRVGARSFVARLLRENRAFTALLDDGSWHAPSLAGSGIDLERLLVLPVSGFDELVHLRLLDLLLRVRACSYVVVHGDTLRLHNWRPSRFARLHDIAARGNARLIILSEHAMPHMAAVAQVRLECTLRGIAWFGTHGPQASPAGYDIAVHVAAHRRNAKLQGNSMMLRCAFDAFAHTGCEITMLHTAVEQSRVVRPLRRTAAAS